MTSSMTVSMPTGLPPLRTLLVEDNAGDAFLVDDVLHSRESWSYLDREVTCESVSTLAAAEVRLRLGGYDAVLLDLTLPDSTGLATVARVRATAPDIPLVVLTGITDATVTAAVVHAGADEFVPKGQLSHVLLARALRYAIDRRSTVRALRASDERYRLIGRATKDVMWDWNLVTNAISWGDAMTTVFGHPVELLQHGIEDWKANIHPDDRARVVASIEQAIARGLESWNETYRFRRGDGRYALVLDRGYLLTEDARVTRMVGAMTDLSAWKEAEERILFQARLLDQVEQAVVVTDAAECVTFWNRFAELLYGWKAEEVQGRNLGALLLVEEGDPRADDARAQLRAGRSWHGEVAARRRDGRTLPAYVTATPIHDDEGRLTAMATVSFDLSERKQLEDQLRQAQKMEAVGRLAGGIAHDFNNLLTAMLASAEAVLSELASDDPHGEDVRLIRDAALKAADLTRQLLAFSRQQVLRVEDVSVDGVIERLVPMLRRMIGEHVSLETELATAQHAVRADRGQLDQVVVNLVVNARDAMPQGGRILVRTRLLEGRDVPSAAFIDGGGASGAYVELSVTDSGVGMDEATQARIFEPFFTTKAMGRGTGLGLSSVFGIVRQLRGHVSVRSRPGEGSTFLVYLPASAGVPSERAAPPVASPAPARAARVLIVEDDPPVRTITARALRRRGHEVTAAEDAEDALRLVEASAAPFDVLITDLMMPGMSGQELAAVLRARQPSLQVLFMSGFTRDEAFRDTGVSEDVAFLEKPFSIDALYAAVDRVLAGG